MKELEIFRYLKKYWAVIVTFSLILGVLFFLAAQFYIQQYTASTVIEYISPRASDGLSPDGSAIDTSEIYAANIIAQAMSELGMDYTETTMDTIRSSIRVEPVLTSEEQLLKTSKLESGEEDFKLNPTRYLVSFSCGVKYGKEYPRKMLNQILQDYAAYYGKTHVNSSVAANPVNDITSKGFDYLEMVEAIESTLADTMEQLSNKIDQNSGFRSSGTGYSFQDIYDEFSFIRYVEVRQVFAEILSGRITRDRDLLLDKYRNRNNDLSIANEAALFESERIQGIISAYEDAMAEFSVYPDSSFAEGSGETVLENNVLPDVYDDWEHEQNQEGNWTPVDRTTEYDLLLMKYIANRTEYEFNLIDRTYNEYILSVFESAPAASSQQSQEKTLEEISQLVNKIDTLHKTYYATNDEYNEYLGARNIMVLSNVKVTERFPLVVFTLMLVVVFGAVGCAGAVLFGRVGDFIEYYAFTNKVDGLPNRAKCDQYIASWEKRPLPEEFACVVLKISNLQTENARLGRETGNQMIREFAEVLTSVFVPSDKVFVGNNGAGQYLIFAEGLSTSQTHASLILLGTLLEHSFKGKGYQMWLQSGFACVDTTPFRYIRGLLSQAIQRVGSGKKEAPEKELADTQV